MDAATHKQRRERFMKEMAEGSAALFFANPERLRNGDVHYGYRQDSDMAYLTGFPEPESAALLCPASDTPYVLFVRPRNREREIWDGRRYGVEGAKEVFGADATFPIEELAAKLPELCAPALSLYATLGRDDAFDRIIIGLLLRTRRSRQKEDKGPLHVLDPGPILHEMRLIKGPEEIACLRRAAAISAAAHRRAMEVTRPGAMEYEVQAALEETFRRLGSPRVGYGSIVASGVNATILHYVDNDRRIGAQDLVLIDAGTEVEHYTADITRTFPAGATFAPAQRRVYDVVLRAQLEGIAEVQAGRPWDRVHERAKAVLIEGLIDLGLLSGTVEENAGKDDFKKFYMHNTSHWLGMDVHDVGPYRPKGTARPLLPGMVLTVEPGLYFHPDLEGIPDEYRGIGVRIEDDVLVTERGPDVLTCDAPKDVAAIEQARREALASSRA